MVELTREDAHRYWRSYSDPRVYRALVSMESMEDWTLDGDPELEQAMTEFGLALDGIKDLDLEEQGRFVQVLSRLHMTRVLYIMQLLDQGLPGSASKLLAYAESHYETDSDAKLFVNRNILFERLRLLARVFSYDRFKQLQAVFEDA